MLRDPDFVTMARSDVPHNPMPGGDQDKPATPISLTVVDIDSRAASSVKQRREKEKGE
jgi:hypothetical protein